MLLSLGCLNPNLVNSTTGRLYPLAPGDQPFVLATVINDTLATVDLQINVDEGRSTPSSYFFTDLDPLSRTAGTLVPYPFLRIAIGNLDNPFAPSIVGTFPDGLTIQVPFGQPALVAGQDLKKGDTIIFHLVADTRSPTAIHVDTGVLDGSTQQGPFSREDTFAVARLLLLTNGLAGFASGSTP